MSRIIAVLTSAFASAAMAMAASAGASTVISNASATGDDQHNLVVTADVRTSEQTVSATVTANLKEYFRCVGAGGRLGKAFYGGTDPAQPWTVSATVSAATDHGVAHISATLGPADAFWQWADTQCPSGQHAAAQHERYSGIVVTASGATYAFSKTVLATN
jgi:hypothetical protein